MAPILPDVLPEIRSNLSVQYKSEIGFVIPLECYYRRCLAEKFVEKSYWNSQDFPMDAAESVVMVLHTVFLVFLVWYSYKKNEERDPLRILFLGYSSAIIFRAALWFIRYVSPNAVYSRLAFYDNWFIIFVYSTFFINFFHLILVPLMSLSISLKFSKHQLIFQLSLLISTVLLASLGAWIKLKLIEKEYIFNHDAFGITNWFFREIDSWLYFLPLLITLLFPMISFFNRKQSNFKKPISPNEFKFTSIVIIAGFLYAIPITVAYLENNDFMNLFNSYPNVHLYHYAPEIFIPVTVTVLSIEWKKKVVSTVTVH